MVKEEHCSTKERRKEGRKERKKMKKERAEQSKIEGCIL